ncbi:MAG: hypothetical protein IJU16_08525 [Clostridia bacterium]|nr:hypothetical protein [Clostridia bacterium]
MTIGQTENGIVTLTPDEGRMLTNGETETTGTVYLGKNDRIENWAEIDRPPENEE